MSSSPAELPVQRVVEEVISRPVHFPAGIPGFEDHKTFVLVTNEHMNPFQWLQSQDDPEVSLPVINGALLKEEFWPQLDNKHLGAIGDPRADEVVPYFVLRINSRNAGITVNTKAPVLISSKTRRGCQIILDGDDLRMDHPLVDLVLAP